MTTKAEIEKIMEYSEKKKKLGVAYALWWFLGLIGAHRMYAAASEENNDIVCYLEATCTALGLLGMLVAPIFGLLLLVSLVFWLADVTLLPALIKKSNFEIMSKLDISLENARLI